METRQQTNRSKRWEVLHRLPSTNHKSQTVVDVLLANRGIKTEKEKKEFFKPTPPEKISVKSLSISSSEIRKAIARIKKAKDRDEKVIIYGDYDADGICATAILWQCLYAFGLDVLPYIPERFSEGYGLKVGSVRKLKKKYPNLGLIITVDNGIVAHKAVKAANGLGIDVIVTDHHQLGRTTPSAYCILHATKISGAGIAWIFARELNSGLRITDYGLLESLDLCAIGTIADQLPLIGPNRSLAKYGLKELNKTKRAGLLALFEEARIKRGQIGTYEVGFIIAPRINAMGRLEHAIDSLRLLCTKNKSKARELAHQLGKTNTERRRIVEGVVTHARSAAEKRVWEGVIVLSHESYHEGVIGLAASRLVEEFYRPAIVISRGELQAKASARSIPGFNIIKVIRKLDTFLLDGGGHPMAAGFSIESEKIEAFMKELEKISTPLLTEEVLSRKLKIDTEVDFNQLNWDLLKAISSFEPTGIGNPTPTFVSRKVNLLDARCVGFEGRHLKLTLEKNDKVFDAIAFNFGEYYLKLSPDKPIDVAFALEENVWRDKKNLQLKVKDIKY